MSRFTITAAVLSAAFIATALAANNASAEPSVCKGLDNAQCTANAACKWMPERIAGQTMTKAGTPAKTSAKAHCRKGSGSTATVKAPV